MINSFDYDQYAFMILNCNSIAELDAVMFHAADDPQINHKEYISLSLLSKKQILSFEDEVIS